MKPHQFAPAACRVEAVPRRGLSREQAATYVGVGTTKFDEMVRDGEMPKPRRAGGRLLWDIRELDLAFDNLPKDVAENPWDRVA